MVERSDLRSQPAYVTPQERLSRRLLTSIFGDPSQHRGAIYLAGRYQRRAEIAGYADELRATGWEVTANWLNESGRVLPDGTTLGEHQEWLVERPFDSPDGLRIGGMCAQQDVDDVLAADTLVMFTEGGRGGRHVEFGIALGHDMRVIVVGARENVFHTLPEVEVYATWPEAFRALSQDAVEVAADA